MTERFKDSALGGAVADLRTLSFLLGTAGGWKDAAAWARKQSGPAFAAGLDDRARFLRDLADELDGLAAAEREEYDERKKGEPELWAVVEAAWRRGRTVEADEFRAAISEIRGVALDLERGEVNRGSQARLLRRAAERLARVGGEEAVP